MHGMARPFFMVVLFAAVVSNAHAARLIYVSPFGATDGKGTASSPYSTMEQARDAIRGMKRDGGLPVGGVTVILGRGTHERVKPFELTKEDSGTPQAPIVYRAQVPGTARVVGGHLIKDFKALTDSDARDKITRQARENVLQADLRAAGLTDYGELTERGFGRPTRQAQMELFFESRPMTLARWPNGEYAKIAGLPDGKDGRRFNYDGEQPRRWIEEPDGWVYGYWYHDWADTYLKIDNIDIEKHIIQTTNKHNYGLRRGHRWFALNLLSELDSPGEYYIDREKGTLYFWPPSPLADNHPIVSVADTLVTAKDVSHVTLRGIVFEVCRGTALTFSGASNVQVVACTIRNTGNGGLSISGQDSAVIGCDVYHNGDGGISLRGGDRKTLTPAHLIAENNYIHDFSRWCHTYRAAIGGGSCGIVARNNLIHDGPHSGIMIGGNDNLIEFNEMHSVLWDTGDCGAFYSGRDWTARGTQIRYNYWHHIKGPGVYGGKGVYLDDQLSGYKIFGNVFYKVTEAVFIGGGDDNTVDNNIFIDCNPAVHIDARGLGWQKEATDDPKGTLRSRFRSMPVTSELWRKRYPNLASTLEDDPGTPKRNRIIRNICLGGKWEDLHKPTLKYQTVENNLILPDPIPISGDKLSIDLKSLPSPPPEGFQPIPTEKIGLYKSTDRASWPVEHKPRGM